jgi:hypothetical protein
VRLISAINWWLRSPYCNSNNGSQNAFIVNSNGDWNNNNCSNSNGIRPALMENEISRLCRRQCAIIKGSRILSKACAWADDKYITPRQTAPLGAQPATGERGPALG